jgi:hypothetical protein
MARSSGSPARSLEDLPYVIELWGAEVDGEVERVLARALNAQLSRAIFKAAVAEHPDRRLTLRKGSRVMEDTQAKAQTERDWQTERD